MTTDTHLDTRGLKCPLPVLKARKALSSLSEGEVLSVQADDPAGLVDFPHFCTEQGHVLLAMEDGDAGATVYRIRKGG